MTRLVLVVEGVATAWLLATSMARRWLAAERTARWARVLRTAGPPASLEALVDAELDSLLGLTPTARDDVRTRLREGSADRFELELAEERLRRASPSRAPWWVRLLLRRTDAVDAGHRTAILPSGPRSIGGHDAERALLVVSGGRPATLVAARRRLDRSAEAGAIALVDAALSRSSRR